MPFSRIILRGIQKSFLRHLYWVARQSPPGDGVRTVDLLKEFEIDSLCSRRSVAQLRFLRWLCHGQVDVAFLLACLKFNVPSMRSRMQSELFFKLAYKDCSPLHRVLQCFNEMSRPLDLSWPRSKFLKTLFLV